MAARSADPAFHVPSFPSSLTQREPHVVAAPHAPLPDETLGAFRGLAFAVIFEFLVGFAIYGGWLLLRHLR
jgi:hypothetical protein